MRLPVVHLERWAGGKKEERTENTTDYARNISARIRDGWRLKSEYTPPDTPDAVVDFARRQDIKEIARAANPRHEASRDEQRRYEHRQGRPNIVTEDWRAMRWFERRQFVKKVTGRLPKNAADAEKLMKGY